MSPVINSLADLDEWLASQRPPEPTQECILCEKAYPVSHFRTGRPGPGWKRCESCRTDAGQYQERQRQLNRDSARRRNLKRLYDITPEEYDARREQQGFRCASCRRHEDELEARQTGRPRLDGKPGAEPMKLHVDHDHDTNEIRGLLCHNCNMGLGAFRDQIDWLVGAIEYLKAGGFNA